MAHKLTNSRPLISIVLSTFNGSAYLQEQTDSILTQSYPHFELIIADDASTDGTINLIRDYEQRDDRIIPIFHDRNQGISKNLADALRRAKGAYIAISDQDDIWHKNKIETLLENIGICSAIYTDSTLIDAEGTSLGKTLHEQMKKDTAFQGNNPLKLLYRNYVSGHAMLFKKDLLEYCLPFSEEIMYDRQLAITAALSGGVAFHDRPLVYHRMHQNNQTNRLLAGHKHHRAKDESPSERQRRKRTDIIKTLAFTCTMQRKLGSKGKAFGQPEQKVLEKLLFYYRKFDDTFFNCPFLLMLFRYRNSIFFYSKKSRILKCIKTARGDKLFRFFSLL